MLTVTGCEGQLRVKQETQAAVVAVARDHVTVEDVEMFQRVQELSCQVRRRHTALLVSPFEIPELSPDAHRVYACERQPWIQMYIFKSSGVRWLSG